MWNQESHSMVAASDREIYSGMLKVIPPMTITITMHIDVYVAYQLFLFIVLGIDMCGVN